MLSGARNKVPYAFGSMRHELISFVRIAREATADTKRGVSSLLEKVLARSCLETAPSLLPGAG